MPCTDRQAYNARRGAKYRRDPFYHHGQKTRSKEYRREARLAERVEALPWLPATIIAASTGLSRHQVAYLERQGIMPSLNRGEVGKSGKSGEGVKRHHPKVTMDQLAWITVGLYGCMRQETFFAPSMREAFDLTELQAFLWESWNDPFPREAFPSWFLASRALTMRQGRLIEYAEARRLEREALPAPLSRTGTQGIA